MNKRFKDTVLVVILALGFLIVLYPKAFFSPNSFLFNAHGDAMKNYYTYAYYIKNNTSNIEFEGMNYPYSEHFLYTDCHPIQAAVLKNIHTYIPALADYSIGLLNFMMLLSLVITTIILYLIFDKLKINRLLSVLGSVAITILSPQIFRITGHFALSYSFVIPLTIYILLLFEDKPHWKYILFLIISILVFFFYTCLFGYDCCHIGTYVCRHRRH